MTRTGAGSGPVVGNDVVDLSRPRTRGRAGDRRFVERIFAASERDSIAAAGDPDIEVWRFWAAKEAAFKVVTKLLGAPPPFAHAAFVVEPAGSSRASVRWDDLLVPVALTGGWEEGGIHAVAWGGEGSAPDRAPFLAGGTARLDGGARIPLDRFTERECRALHSPQSAWVRLHARTHAARLAERPESEVEIVCPEGPPGRTPPSVYVGGRRGGEEGWDVSLSHDGPLLAWMLTRRGPGGGDPGTVRPPALP